MKSLVSAAAAAAAAAADATTHETRSSPTQDFLHDPQIQKLAPHLLHHAQQILHQPTPQNSPRHHDDADAAADSSSSSSALWASQHPPLTPIAVLNDMIKIVCLVFAQGGSSDNDNDGKGKSKVGGSGAFDLSKIEAAKLEAVRLHGEEAVHAASNFSTYDTETCATLVDTIYDTVAFIQPLVRTPNPQQPQQQQQVAWGFETLGQGLDQASRGVQTLQAMIVPPRWGGCETQDQQFLQGAEDVTYSAAMAYGLAGATLASAPPDSAVKALDVGQIIVSVAQLAIGFWMAQNVARMAGLDPAEPSVKSTIYLTLAGEVDSARDLNRLRDQAMEGEVPRELLERMDRHSAEVLVIQGPGQPSMGPSLWAKVPVLGNVFAFSDQWLGGNRVGKDVKFVFCPEMQRGEEEALEIEHAADMDETVEESVEGEQEQVDNKLEL
ncbi:unnamed protein product [Mortierella alpina]